MSYLAMNNQFDLDSLDRALIHDALKTAQQILQRHDLTAIQKRGLRTAIEALENLPAVTEDVNVAFGAVADFMPHGEVKDGYRYLLFYVSSEAFGITTGGMVDHGYGMDSFVSDGYDVYLRREAARYYPAHDAQYEILMYLDDGGRVEVDDQSIYSD